MPRPGWAVEVELELTQATPTNIAGARVKAYWTGETENGIGSLTYSTSAAIKFASEKDARRAIDGILEGVALPEGAKVVGQMRPVEIGDAS